MARSGISASLDDRVLRKLTANMVGELEDVLDKAAHNVEARAKQNIVDQDIIDTGATLNTTQARNEGRKWERVIGPSTDYSPHLELGTSTMAARPFLTPALEEEAGPFKAAVLGVMEKKR